MPASWTAVLEATRRRAEDVTALVSPLVLTLAVTYPGVLGGAERTLLDFTRGLPGGLVLACPEGALADRARADGVSVIPSALRGRSSCAADSATGSAPGARWPATARDVRRLVREVGPDLLVAWGMRTAIVAPAAATAMDKRPAVVARHVDFLPGPAIARLMRASVARADRVSRQLLGGGARPRSRRQRSATGST